MKQHRRKPFGEAALWARFRREVVRTGQCVMLGMSPCDGPLQCAHVLPKQRLKWLGLAPEAVYDVRAAIPLCHRHHNRHDRWLERVPPERIPRTAWDWAEENSLGALLERYLADLSSTEGMGSSVA